MNTKTCVRASFYRESFDIPNAPKEHPTRGYLVLYHTDFEELLKSDEYLNNVQKSSPMWPTGEDNLDVGDFDVRNYTLIQDYNPDGKAECEGFH